MERAGEDKVTALADLTQGVEIPTAGFADEGVSGSALHLDTQQVHGSEQNFRSPASAEVLRRTAAGSLMQLTYTPPVACYAEVFLFAYLNCTTSTWDFSYLGIGISPAPVAGPTNYWDTESMNYAAGQAGGGECARTHHATFQLAASTAYTISANFSPGTGAWRYYMGDQAQRMIMFAWGR